MCDGECLFPDAISSYLLLSLCTVVSALKKCDVYIYDIHCFCSFLQFNFLPRMTYQGLKNIPSTLDFTDNHNMVFTTIKFLKF